MSETKPQKVAVIGAGWAGCAAAVTLAEAKITVFLYESRTILGGRARKVEIDNQILDNGQHILLGAYTESLGMMKKVGVNTDQAFLRLPLQMCYPPQSGLLTFETPSLPAPFHLLFGLLRSEGLEMADKMALARFISAAKWMGWTLNEDCAVTTLLERFGQTVRLYRLLWRPLCIAALNTIPEQASAKIFLHVLRDSIGAGKKASDMLIPKIDFSALFPEKAQQFIQQKGGHVLNGKTVRSVQKTDEGFSVDGEIFDAVIVATSAQAAVQLLGRQMDMEAFKALEFEPIHTCYFGYSPNVKLPRAFFALEDDASRGKWGQFVFDRGYLNPQSAGVLAVVISASSSTSGLLRQELEQQVAKQLAKAFHLPDLAKPLWSRTFSEQQATFSCKPALLRPQMKSNLPGLFFAGDYIQSDYPGTLESAVRSGINAAQSILEGGPDN